MQAKHLADLHVPKKRLLSTVLFKRFFFFADSRRKKGFQPLKNLYFCVDRQKRKNCSKRTSKKNSYFGTRKPANCIAQ